MTTKKDCIEAVAALGGVLEHEDDFGYWTTNIEAPKYHHWGDCHNRVVEWFKTSGHKEEYWDDVMYTIKDLKPVKCDDDPWCREEHGICEYWEDDSECSLND